jgi:hypothetical protein
MDLANDERLRSLNDQIQAEKDPQKLGALIDELGRLLELGNEKRRGFCKSALMASL